MTGRALLDSALTTAAHDEAMDLIAVALALAVFAALRALIGARPHMSASDLVGLIVSALICVYLLYALLRGERF